MPRDARATVCPVCNRVVPVRRGADPNIAVNDHIAAGCPDPGTSTTKASDNACSFKDCSKRELVPIRCPSCSRTFCIRHRLEADHKCSKMQAAGSSPRTARANLAASAAASRSSQSSAAGQRAKQISEDEQLAKALQRSEEERAGGGSGSGGAKPSNCKVS
ncbi:zinc finger, AN1-type domain [Polyrhizophydium stewartii]|uniref:Zinc finger, AN1-type domain n=1 Tax=Polyrhizophydium stewartii TaxID=2732419 RepID=A0ABR4NKG6_9FUNG